MKLVLLLSTISAWQASALLSKPTAPMPILGECQFDCDTDADCQPGLWCADPRKVELAAAGFDARKANCGSVGAWNEEVCFNPAILIKTGGGGGGMYCSKYTLFYSFQNLSSSSRH
jgi:hypothetical protein